MTATDLQVLSFSKHFMSFIFQTSLEIQRQMHGFECPICQETLEKNSSVQPQRCIHAICRACFDVSRQTHMERPKRCRRSSSTGSCANGFCLACAHDELASLEAIEVYTKAIQKCPLCRSPQGDFITAE